MSATPLYSRVRVTAEQEDVERLYKLVNDLVDHPEHGATVKEFVYKCRSQRIFCGKHEKPTVNKLEAEESERTIEDADGLISALRSLGLSNEEEQRWLRHLTWMKPELVVEREKKRSYFCSIDRKYNALFAQHAATLLLTMCPNIERLTYEDNSRESRSPFPSFLKRNNYERLPRLYLQKLRELHITHNKDDSDERFYDFMDPLTLLRHFHRLPLLEKVSMQAITPNYDSGFRDNFPPASSNVKVLQLRHVQLPSSVSGPMILMSKGLEEFTMTEGGRATIDGGYCTVYLETISQALRRHRSTLRKLDLDLESHWAYNAKNDPLASAEDDDNAEDQDENEDSHDGFRDEYTGQDEEDATNVILAKRSAPVNECQGVLRFGDFAKLTHLSIGIHLLLGGAKVTWDDQGKLVETVAPSTCLLDSLPANLEYLLIRGYKHGEHAVYDAEIEKLLADKGERLRNLKEVRGVEECIPIAETVEHPDENEDLLWEPEELDDTWQEAKDDVGGFRNQPLLVQDETRSQHGDEEGHSLRLDELDGWVVVLRDSVETTIKMNGRRSAAGR